ncbi:MAG: NUDIX hydrolase, partial [Candidatus Wildermuthbacteria bacterium]|nr:NUDIX hydrolase [Candidatus Wildermuthbacteria bacterium]
MQDKLKYLILKIMGIKPESSNGVSVIIRDPNNYEKILVVKHNYAMKKWSLPGGGIHQGEMPHLAAKREALEESNLNITKLRQIGTFTLVKKKEQLFVFEVEEFEDQPFVNGINISDWKFIESGT